MKVHPRLRHAPRVILHSTLCTLHLIGLLRHAKFVALREMEPS
jgi:hypothetical protein